MRVPRALPSTIAAVLILLSGHASSALAGFVTTVTADAAPRPGGLFLYSYTLSNDASSTVGAYEFALSVNGAADLRDITAPTGFLSLYTPGDFEIHFLSTDPSADIAPGASGMFSFLSPLAAGLMPEVTRGFDDSTGELLENPGMTLAPVPEPSTIALFATGSTVLALAAVLRRRR